MSVQYGQKLVVLFFISSVLHLQQFLMLPVLSRNLGLEVYGIWSQLSAAVNLLVPLALLALPDSFVRFSAGERERKVVAMNYYTILTTIAISAFVFAGIFYGLSSWVSLTFIQVKQEVTHLVQLASLMLFFQVLAQYSTTYFSAFQREKAFSFFQFFQGTATLSVVLLVVYWGGDLASVLLAFAGMHFFRFSIAQLLIVGEIGLGGPRKELLQSFMAYSLPLVPMSILNWVLNLSDRYVIGFFLPLGDVAKYSACYSISMVLQFIYAPFFLFLLPKLTSLWKQGQVSAVRKILNYSNKLPLLIAVPSVCGLGILHGPILKTITGKTVEVPFSLMPIICIGLLFFYIGSFYAQVFSLAKKTKFITLGFSLAAVANIAGNIVLVPWIGIIGAAYMTLLTFLLQMLYYKSKAKPLFNVRLSWGFLWKCIAAACIMTSLLLFFQEFIVDYSALAQITLSAALGTVVYLVSCVILRVFSREEIESLLDVAKGVIRV
jgi:O-antigen/teichoic acid export membrane protein